MFPRALTLAFAATLLWTAAFAQPEADKAAAAKPAAEKPAGEKPAEGAKEAAPDASKDAKKDEKPVDVDKLREEAFARGKRAYDRGDWLKALIDLRPLAEWGDVRAMMLLGNMYSGGNGVGKDPKEAFALYHRAAVANNLDGMVATAAMYQTGLGVAVNTRLAIGWFERAARLGSQQGAFFYGIHKFQGSKGTSYDLKADHAEAYKWFRIAATKGTDKKLRRAAYQTSEKLATRLPPDRVIEMNKFANEWAPDTLLDVGDNPEDVLVKEMQAKGETVSPDGPMPEEKPEVKPEPKKDEGESLIPPG